MEKKAGPPSDWKNFESEISHLFRAAGYRVERNVELAGQEFDLIATRRSLGNFDIRIAVECKYRASQAVSNSDVHEFVNAFKASRDSQRLNWGILVTNSTFSRQAYEAASVHPDIRLIHQRALEDELLGARTYLEGMEAAYRSAAAGYIPLQATLVSPVSDGPTISPDISHECHDRICASGSSFTFLLGDFGSGKTTIAEHIHRSLGQSYLSSKSDVFPVILYLRSLEQYDSDRDFVDAHLKLSASEFTVFRLRSLAERVRLCYVLDGFDEVATNAGEEDRYRLFSRAMRLAGDAQHVLLTSRPSYFNNFSELRSLLNQVIQKDYASAHGLGGAILGRDASMETTIERQQEIVRRKVRGGEFPIFPENKTSIYVLNPLTRDDIVGYFRQHETFLSDKYAMSPDEVYTFLSNVYDLTDLLTRPLLLDMFLDLLLEGAISFSDPDLQIGPAGLYHLYINIHLERDWAIRRFLRPPERLAFARAAAVAMLETAGSLEATYESVKSIVDKGGAIFRPARREFLGNQTESVVTDVRVCSFMNITAGGRIEFSHKSFMEYFVADVIVGQLRQSVEVELLHRSLNYEILYFLGSFCTVRSTTKHDLIQHLMQFGSLAQSNYRTNLLVALLFSDRVSNDASFRDFSFGRIRLTKRRFEGCHFSTVRLTAARIEDCEFTGCSFAGVELEGELSSVLISCSAGAITFGPSTVRLTISDCDNLRVAGPERSRLVMARAEIKSSNIDIDGEVEFSDSDIRHVRIGLSTGASLALQSSRLEDVQITSSHPEDGPARVRMKMTRLRNVAFGLVEMDLETVRLNRSVLSRSKGLISVRDPNGEAHAFLGAGFDTRTGHRGWQIGADMFLVQSAAVKSIGVGELGDLAESISKGMGVQTWVGSHIMLEGLAGTG